MKFSGFSDELRQKCFIDDGIIMHDYDNHVFQQTFWVNGIDLESAEEHELNGMTEYLNLIFAGIPTGWTISVNSIIVNDNKYLNAANNHFEIDLLKLLDSEREYFFTRQAKIFKNITTITFTYIAQHKTIKKLGRIFVQSNKQSAPQTLEIILDEFKRSLEQYTKLINRALKLTPMTNDETISYLRYLLTGEWINLKLPKKTYIELKFLLGEDYIGGLDPQVGNKHMRVIAIDNYFPDESRPLMLERIRALGFELRWCTRFMFLTKIEAQKNITYLSDLHEQNITGIKHAASAGTKFESRRYNRGAEYLYEEAEEALASSIVSNVNYGKYSCNIVVFNENEETVKQQATAISVLLKEMGFIARIETLNAEEAFMSTIDGDIEHNERRSLISTENLAHLLPLSGFWGGLDYHPSPMYPEQSNSLFMVDCNNYHSFKGNLFVDGLGHSLIIGKSGTGKSTLVNFIIASHMRYKDAQVFGLDNKHSMMPLCYGVNGQHYDLGHDETSFQPLADIDQVSGYDFAIDWIEALCEINHVKVDTSLGKAIRDSLTILSVMDKEHRTLINFLLHCKSKHEELASVIELYVGHQSLQSRVMSANEDRISFSNYNVFEMNEFVHKGEKALIPVLKYIFYKIMAKLDGRPTLIVIEEADTLWTSHIFAKKLDEWLKTLRKLNVYILMVTLNVQSIAESSIRNTLLTQCASIIFTPNADLGKIEVYESYKKFGIKDKQIQLIKQAKPQKEYYLINNDGDRLFNLDINYFEIAKSFFSRTSKNDSIIAKQIKREFKDKFANEWLKNSGVSNIEL